MVEELFLVIPGGTPSIEGWDPLLHSTLGYFGPPLEEDTAHETHPA